MPATTNALPGRPGRAHCPRCGRDDIRTVWRGDKEVYVVHDHVPDGGVICHNSGQQVKRP